MEMKDSRQMLTEVDVFFNPKNRRDTVPLQKEDCAHMMWGVWGFIGWERGKFGHGRVPSAGQLPCSQGVADTSRFNMRIS